MQVTVRSMIAADLPQVGILAGMLVRMHHAFDEARFMRPSDPERGYERWFATQLDRKDVILLVAGDEAGIAGSAFARIEGRSYDDLLEAHAKLHDILVHPRARGRGVGEALLREVFARSADRGAPRVILLTASQNEAAQRLFAKLGFRKTMLEMTRELGRGDG